MPSSDGDSSGSSGVVIATESKRRHAVLSSTRLSPTVRGVTVFEVLAERSKRDPARPLVTFLRFDGDHVAERMELSALSAANGVAKIAGLLRDEFDIEPGDPLPVHLPLHWQTPLWTAAAAATGAVLMPGATPVGGVGVSIPETISHITGADDQLAVSREPFGMPITQSLPPGVTDAAIAQRSHPDVFVPFAPVPESAEAITIGDDTVTHAEVDARAESIITRLGLTDESRLLVTDEHWSIASIDAWLLLLAVPLLSKSCVILATADNAEVSAETWQTTIDSEGITHRASDR